MDLSVQTIETEPATEKRDFLGHAGVFPGKILKNIGNALVFPTLLASLGARLCFLLVIRKKAGNAYVSKMCFLEITLSLSSGMCFQHRRETQMCFQLKPYV